MADQSLQIEISVGADLSGATASVQALDQVKTSAKELDTVLSPVRQPPKFVDTEQFKIYAAGAREVGSAADDSAIRLGTMREAMQGLNGAANGSAIGLARAIEGIAKISGATGPALAAIEALAQKLGAAGVGLGIGSAIGDAIYQNIVTPVWDAIDAYEQLNDPVAQAYEAAKNLNREILATRSLKLREVIVEIDGVKTALEESEKQAEETKRAIADLVQSEAKLEEARVRNAEASGKITSTEAQALLSEIRYRTEITTLLEKQALAQEKLAKIPLSNSVGYRDQEAVVAKANTDVETAKVNRQTSEIEIGGQARKDIQDLLAAIKVQESRVTEARSRIEPARQTGSNSALQTAITDAQQQEIILNSLRAQAARIQSTMGEAVRIFESSVVSTGKDAGGALGSAATEIKAAGTVFVTAAAAVSKDVQTAGQTATAAVSTSTGQVTGSIIQMGQDVSGALSIMGTQITSTLQALVVQVNKVTQSVAASQRTADAAYSLSQLSLSQLKNSR